MMKLQIDEHVMAASLAKLHASGRKRHEGIVLWLGKRERPTARITHVFEPLHRASIDFFHIPPQGMQQLMAYLEQHDVALLAQVHTHPAEAFHSQADDKWAMVRHLNALSLVLPYFAEGVTPRNFLSMAATFRLDELNRWVPVRAAELPDYLEVKV